MRDDPCRRYAHAIRDQAVSFLADGAGAHNQTYLSRIEGYVAPGVPPRVAGTRTCAKCHVWYRLRLMPSNRSCSRNQPCIPSVSRNPQNPARRLAP